MATAALHPFRRPRHQRIAELLEAFDADLLLRSECYFGGGTAIALALDEYRESVDVDFMCSSVAGYRTLRSLLTTDLGPLLRRPIKHLRGVKSDQNKILTFLEIGDVPIKVEFVREGNTTLQGQMDERLRIPVLSRTDLWAQKLMANADRALDKSTMSRDIIDLAMMMRAWGPLPREAFDKAFVPYGDAVARGIHNAAFVIADRAHLLKSMTSMDMDTNLADEIEVIIDDAAAALPLTEAESAERANRVDALAQLERKAGAPFIFGRAATAALARSGDVANVNWAKVEREAVQEGIAVHGRDPHEMIDVISALSPAAVSPARIKAFAARVERQAPGLESSYRGRESLGAANDCAN